MREKKKNTIILDINKKTNNSYTGENKNKD